MKSHYNEKLGWGKESENSFTPVAESDQHYSVGKAKRIPTLIEKNSPTLKVSNKLRRDCGSLSASN